MARVAERGSRRHSGLRDAGQRPQPVFDGVRHNPAPRSTLGTEALVRFAPLSEEQLWERRDLRKRRVLGG